MILLPPEAAHLTTEVKRRVLEKGNGERCEVKVALGEKLLYYDLIVEPLRNAAVQVVDTSNILINYILRIGTGKALKPTNTNVIVSGPAGTPHNDIRQTSFAFGPDCFIASFVREAPPSPGHPMGSIMLPFGKGTYTITLENKNLYIKLCKY